ncbi:MAG: cob(I)yrinic acid a,c-diamide adenosyltransferase [Candidatus Woesearchaeota archaeon]|jgi:ATP:corrinoid adenosyltransferase|nr:cob(I)yrinic acid a,c-diamide adenosyltransferase [Candidatus Woesearchaeota archaeon]
MFYKDTSKTIYLDKNIIDYSNLSAGLLIKAIGLGMKIAYIDTKDSATKLSNFIENLSLSYSFTNSLKRFQLDIYKPKQNKKISKTIIPLVEFCNITQDMFYNSLYEYDLVIIDNLNFEILNKMKIISLLKNSNSQIIITTKEEEIFNEIKSECNSQYICEYIENHNLVINKNITNISGNGKGKTAYPIGYLIRKFLEKHAVKLIYFDKGDDIYGDPIFLNSLKKWSRENNLYGSFDFVKTGIKRQFNNQSRDEITPQDIKEANEALMLLKTSIKKQSPVIADELNTIIEKKIINLDEILPILNDVKNELIITGNTTNQKLLNLAKLNINIIKTN